jgi:hypothetical protein
MCGGGPDTSVLGVFVVAIGATSAAPATEPAKLTPMEKLIVVRSSMTPALVIRVFLFIVGFFLFLVGSQ